MTYISTIKKRFITEATQGFEDNTELTDYPGDVNFSAEASADAEEEIDEISTTAGVPGYQTPYAFGGLSDDDIEMLGYKKVKKVRKESKNESQFMKMSKELYLNEIAYSTYKKDPVATPKQKINQSINFINKGLREIENVVNHNVRLKQEMGIDNNVYWKSSRENLAKISERLLRVSKQLKELAS